MTDVCPTCGQKIPRKRGRGRGCNNVRITVERSLTRRLGWPCCQASCRLQAVYAFGAVDCQAVVVANNGQGSVIVEFTHPRTGRQHQAVSLENEVAYDG